MPKLVGAHEAVIVPEPCEQNTGEPARHAHALAASVYVWSFEAPFLIWVALR